MEVTLCLSHSDFCLLTSDFWLLDHIIEILQLNLPSKSFQKLKTLKQLKRIIPRSDSQILSSIRSAKMLKIAHHKIQNEYTVLNRR